MAPNCNPRAELQIDQGTAVLTLTRSRQMNAFDQAMHDRVAQLLDQIELNSDVRALIITGEGRAFCAGQDLRERAAAFNSGDIPDLSGSLENNYNPLILRIAELPIPVIAAVNGMAFGAGAGLAVACDIILCAHSAKFQFGFVNVGLGPDCGTSHFLPRVVGQANALDLSLSARRIDAEEAARLGLASRVFPDDRLLEESRELADRFFGVSRAAIAATKRQVRTNGFVDLVQALASESAEQGQLGETDTYCEAVLRFAVE